MKKINLDYWIAASMIVFVIVAGSSDNVWVLISCAVYGVFVMFVLISRRDV